MSKNVFKYGEIGKSSIKISIDTPNFKPEGDNVQTIDYEELLGGRTIEELRSEKEALEKEIENLEDNIKQKMSEAERVAEDILENAKTEANRIIKKDNDRAQIIRQEANDEKESILSQAREEASRILSEAGEEAEKIKKDSIKQGIEKGYRDGYERESAEVKRLIERVQVILNASIDKRNEIFIETEQQIIGLVLLISKKVIKVISENQKNVVINNVVQALRKLKSRGEVAIRVNLADIELTTQHKKDFIEMVEGVKSIKILEDSTVDRGGCIIETDFGAIDARISSQLHEIEDRILELMPIQSKGKQDNPV
ncbi:MAG TPA: flagellar assembly protein FliH [Spirochaetota bacterium]|nr:flagellar assembly protein FliH [Spirochaetota bacterium]HOS32453.1 flagellar assembly protein FliH [Spirochaetota bacterium]HOS55884.1 flagellar assembly protein FliH [Spirochaetota bacterium]HQF77466.1 flagellar assembly protein FliH [Spirochaetota bacterium]HQJ05624.1 flagellar assembly protein FliH [Spirochaetota bacterium]